MRLWANECWNAMPMASQYVPRRYMPRCVEEMMIYSTRTIIPTMVVIAIVAIVAGVIFGILYVRTSSLFTTIIIHSINNAMAYTLIAFGVGDVSLYEHLGGSTIYWVVYGIAAAVFVACCIEAYFQVFRRMAKMSAK